MSYEMIHSIIFYNFEYLKSQINILYKKKYTFITNAISSNLFKLVYLYLAIKYQNVRYI